MLSDKPLERLYEPRRFKASIHEKAKNYAEAPVTKRRATWRHLGKVDTKTIPYKPRVRI